MQRLTNLDALYRTLQHIKDKHADRPAKICTTPYRIHGLPPWNYCGWKQFTFKMHVSARRSVQKYVRTCTCIGSHFLPTGVHVWPWPQAWLQTQNMLLQIILIEIMVMNCAILCQLKLWDSWEQCSRISIHGTVLARTGSSLTSCVSKKKKNMSRSLNKSYIYWNVHHLDSWIKRDQLDVTCFFISLFKVQYVSDVSTSETYWTLNNEIKKQVTSSWSLFIQLSPNKVGIWMSFDAENNHLMWTLYGITF